MQTFDFKTNSWEQDDEEDTETDVQRFWDNDTIIDQLETK